MLTEVEKNTRGMVSTQDQERSNMGDQLANFKQGKGDYGGIAGWSDDGGDITTKVKSFEPNDYGLYDMAGNVAEWVADVYRPIVDTEFNDFNYYRGNVYTKNTITEEGLVDIITSETMKFDTLSNGTVNLKIYLEKLLKNLLEMNKYT